MVLQYPSGFDSWAGMTLSGLFQRELRRQNKKISLTEAVQSLDLLLPFDKRVTYTICDGTFVGI
jgi:hypothetical protein